jgi:adenylosuccinate lyase
MDKRYENPNIATIWANPAKVARWDQVELAVINARVKLGLVESVSYLTIRHVLEENPADIDWWLARDKEIAHDLQAYVDERRRHLPVELQHLLHDRITSYDTQEAAFAQAFIDSALVVMTAANELQRVLQDLAKKYRFAILLARTHGQWAKLKSFGARILSWFVELREAREGVLAAVEGCRRSKLSGAVGNYGGEGLDPETERLALEILGMSTFVGATQIMPRVVYLPLAQALSNLCGVLEKHSTDFRLMARSGNPLVAEPFGKKQKGSSAMPHKKNTIINEQLKGMARMARGYVDMIEESLDTWEERAIEQSSVERVAWPDLFHVTMRMLNQMTAVFKGMQVYPDHMLKEIINSRGTYASDEAKAFLAEHFSGEGVEAEAAYRVIQLAAFNVFEPRGFWAEARKNIPGNLEEAQALLEKGLKEPSVAVENIRDWISNARLEYTDTLDITEEQVRDYNRLLKTLFLRPGILEKWEEIFKITYLLKQEAYLFEELLT